MVNLVSGEKSLESQDGLFTSLLKLCETKVTFGGWSLTQNIMYSSIFPLNSASILLKKWYKNLENL